MLQLSHLRFTFGTTCAAVAQLCLTLLLPYLSTSRGDLETQDRRIVEKLYPERIVKKSRWKPETVCPSTGSWRPWYLLLHKL